MRLIHSKGFTPAERNQWKVTIFQNLLQSFQTISGAMEEQEVEFEDKRNLVCNGRGQ
jgi:guanine nucleotide-binding protein subunit alpha